MYVYLLRCFSADIDTVLSFEGVVSRPPKPMIETRPFGVGGRRIVTGMAQIRVVLDRDPPPDTAACTWRRVGTTANPKLPTYVPPERCTRNHPPLRYLSNGGCVQCAREAAEPEKSTRCRVQLPMGAEFDDVVKAMGWRVTWQAQRHSRTVLVLDVGRTKKSKAIEQLQALGWEPVV